MEELKKDRAIRIWRCPNIVTLCMDSYHADWQIGRLYHQYLGKPIRFSSVFEAIGQMEAFYDAIQFPYASMNLRSFFIDRKAAERTPGKRRTLPELPEPVRKDMMEMKTFDEATSYRGKDATFIIRVQYRQHSSWQGEVTWVDQKKKEYFRSVLELVRLMDEALEGEKQD